MAPRSNKLAFSLCLFGAMSFWILNLVDRVVLGKHTLNQVILGSELGIWCAFFSHFVLRDQIFAHFNRITSQEPAFGRTEALRTGLLGSAVVACAVLVTCAVGTIMRSFNKLEQEWLINLRDTCGEVYETDENGLLIANENGMYVGYMTGYFSNAGFLGLYIGQIAFRAYNNGRLEHDAFTSKPGLKHQLIFSAVVIVLFMVPRWLTKLLDNDDVNMWVYGIFALAAPQIIFNFVITYTLPKLSVRLTNYPETLPEVTESSDDENPNKTKQIKGKQEILLFQREKLQIQ